MLLNIHQIQRGRSSYLSLEGTILIFHEEKGYKRSVQSELQIPLELISVYERSRLKGSYLIAALLSLLAPMLVGGISYGIMSQTIGVDDSSIYAGVSAVSMLALHLIGFVLFLIFLIKFLVKRKTVCLVISPEGRIIEFWKGHKYSAEVDELLMQIERRKNIIEETLLQPAKRVIGYFEAQSILPKFLALICFFSLPAVVTRKLSLTCLLLLPVAWFLYRKIELSRQPKEYRKALKSYFNKEWDKAINLLKNLQMRIPEYLPAYILLVKVYIRAGRFDEALEVASGLPNEYIDIAQDIQTDIWLHKRIYERRKDNLEEVNEK